MDTKNHYCRGQKTVLIVQSFCIVKSVRLALYIAEGRKKKIEQRGLLVLLAKVKLIKI